MGNTISLPKNPTAEQIEECKQAVKAKYGESATVHKYTVEDKECYLRSVDRNTYSAAMAKVTTSPAKFNEIIVQQIWIGGDEDIKNIDQYYYGLIDFIDELMGKKKGNLTVV